MTNLELWSALVGVVMPLLVATVSQPKWHPGVKAAVAVVSSVIAGGVNCYLNGELTGDNLVNAAGLVLVATIGSYHLFWKPTKIAPKIEALTSRDTAATL